MSRRVIITGAAGGIGGAAAAELRRRGAAVVGLDVNADGDDLLECDIRDQESVDAVGVAIEKLGGGLDVLINNAGVGDPQSAGKPPDEKALAVIDMYLLGAWRVTSAALAALRESRGRVVNVASGLAHVTAPFATAYTMSKRGLVGYSDSLRLEHGDRLGVTTVYPGYIKTKIHEPSSALGIALDGAVPEEDLSDAVRTLAGGAVGATHPRSGHHPGGDRQLRAGSPGTARSDGSPDALAGRAAGHARATSTRLRWRRTSRPLCALRTRLVISPPPRPRARPQRAPPASA